MMSAMQVCVSLSVIVMSICTYTHLHIRRRVCLDDAGHGGVRALSVLRCIANTALAQEAQGLTGARTLWG